MDTDSTMWTPTTYEFFRGNSPKTRQSGEEICEENMLKRVKIP
jgi:hypothetical protein